MLTKLCIYSIKCTDIMTTATTAVCFSSLLTSNIPQYKKILVPHGASIEMMHVIEHAKDIPPSTLLAFIAPDKPLEKAKEELKNMVEEGIRKILEERLKICKEEEKIEQVSYKIEAGKNS
jgi:hypothetical protein